MDRETFLKELRIALQGQISQEKVNENLRYYENYIVEESRKGRTEEQVVEGLGNPRLIAKTIIDTTDVLYTGQTMEEDRETESGSYRKKRGFLIVLLVVLILMLMLFAHVVFLLTPVLIPVLLLLIIFYFLFSGKRK